MQKGSSKQASHFYKLQGAGNDLLVVESQHMPAQNKAKFVRAICHRQLGVGCDQLMEVTSLDPLSIQIWNNDGSKSEMCANGARTFLFFAAKVGWIDPHEDRPKLRVSGRDYEGRRVQSDNYEFSLGEPEVREQEVLPKENIPFTPVITGNPHAIVLTVGKGAWKPPKDFDFKATGSRIENHKRFPKKTNVMFIRALKVKGKTAEIDVDLWERGAGATLSCGSGAVASAAYVRKHHPAITLCKVNMTDFQLRIRFEGAAAFISGPCALVCEGSYFPG